MNPWRSAAHNGFGFRFMMMKTKTFSCSTVRESLRKSSLFGAADVQEDEDERFCVSTLEIFD